MMITVEVVDDFFGYDSSPREFPICVPRLRYLVMGGGVIF